MRAQKFLECLRALRILAMDFFLQTGWQLYAILLDELDQLGVKDWPIHRLELRECFHLELALADFVHRNLKVHNRDSLGFLFYFAFLLLLQLLFLISGRLGFNANRIFFITSLLLLFDELFHFVELEAKHVLMLLTIPLKQVLKELFLQLGPIPSLNANYTPQSLIGVLEIVGL